MKKKIIFIILLLGLVVTFDVVLMSWNSEVEALSKYGSRGTEVRTIQEIPRVVLQIQIQVR